MNGHTSKKYSKPTKKRKKRNHGQRDSITGARALFLLTQFNNRQTLSGFNTEADVTNMHSNMKNPTRLDDMHPQEKVDDDCFTDCQYPLLKEDGSPNLLRF